ncbi:hypothetical protein L1887_15728 [Cichorium endivia]|nr:hypothetical protein L1887_15728 [Cichorium endivia]
MTTVCSSCQLSLSTAISIDTLNFKRRFLSFGLIEPRRFGDTMVSCAPISSLYSQEALPNLPNWIMDSVSMLMLPNLQRVMAVLSGSILGPLSFLEELELESQRETSGKSIRFGFVKIELHDNAKMATESLNGADIGSKNLKLLISDRLNEHGVSKGKSCSSGQEVQANNWNATYMLLGWWSIDKGSREEQA